MSYVKAYLVKNRPTCNKLQIKTVIISSVG